MKITSVEVIKAKRQLSTGAQAVFCRVHTDEGIYGDGEAGVSIADGTKGSFELIKLFGKMIIGMDPLAQDVIYDKLCATMWAEGNGAIIMSAISAIDVALWDIKGKAFGVPVYQLLGGKYRDKVRCYASQIQNGWKYPVFHNAIGDLDFYKEAYRAAMDDGFDAVKINFIQKKADGKRPGNEPLRNYIPREWMKVYIERLEAFRDICGPGVDLMLEMHNQTSAKTAIEFGLAAAPYKIMFMEEANLPLMLGEYKKMAQKLPYPLATGEHTYQRAGFLPLLESGCVPVIQPDLCNCGGLTEGKKIADMAQAFHSTVAPHVCNSPIQIAVSLQFEAAIPNFLIHEHTTGATLQDNIDLCIYDYQPKNGYMQVPDLPGIGNELSPKCLAEADIYTVK